MSRRGRQGTYRIQWRWRHQCSWRVDTRSSYAAPAALHAEVEDVITSDDDLTQANELYWHFVAVNPGRVVLLCDRACVLARSDRLDAMIELTY